MKRINTVVYVAGPFRAQSPWEQECNVRVAEATSLALWQSGFTAICPHTQTRFFQDAPGIPDDSVWLEGTLEMLRRCDYILLCPGWHSSSGTLGEKTEAERLGIPVFYDVNSIVKHHELCERANAESI